jgi:hypothetical protein
MVKVAEKAQTDKASAASADAREPPAMKSHCLTWQSEGFVWREAFIKLPEGMLMADLVDVPEIFKNIQQVRQTELRRFDRVTCVAFDGSWAVKDIMVADADPTGVKLAIKPSDRIMLPGKPAGEVGADAD